MAEFTPGPWVWLKSYSGDYAELVHYVPNETFPNGQPKYVRVLDDGSAGGEYSNSIDPDGPDGMLVQAAPDLYAACQLMVDAITKPGTGPMTAFKAAKDAIAKADGK